MASIVNGFRPLMEWGWWPWNRGRVAVVQEQPATPKDAPKDDAKTGSQARAGSGFGGWNEPYGEINQLRDMLRQPTLRFARNSVHAQILSGSWSVEADDDAPEGAKELIEKSVVAHRNAILKHALDGMDFDGFAGFEVVPGVEAGQETVDHFKSLRGEATTIYIGRDTGAFLGLSTSTDGNLAASEPTITGPECLLWTYDGQPGDYHGTPRLHYLRETVAKWFEVQNKIGALINKESGSVTKVTYPPADISANSQTNAQAFAQNIAKGSAWIAVENALSALTKQQRESATVDQIVKLLELDLWKAENLETGGNGDAIAACKAYAEYLDIQCVRGYLQPERSLLEGEHGTKGEAGIHSDTGTTDCEMVEADIVREAVNTQVVDSLLEKNWGPKARGKVRVVAHPLRDVQEQIDTDLINNLATNSATADEFYRTYDMDAIAARRGIPKRETPLPPPEPKPQPTTPGKVNPLDEEGATMPRLAASRENGQWFDRFCSELFDPPKNGNGH